MIQDAVLLNDWHPVTRADALPEGTVLAARLLGEDLVLWRSSGLVHAWQDLCVHRGARLSLGRSTQDRLACPYHGWEYNPEGKCTRIPAHPDQTPPARAKVVAYQTRERYGLIWVCLGDAQRDIPVFPDDGLPGFSTVLCGPYGPVKASAPRVVENFLDVAHFAFIHAGSLGDATHPEIDEYDVETGPEGIVASNIRVYQPDPYGAGRGEVVTYTYQVLRPLCAYLAKDGANGIRLSILLGITPVDELTTIAWFYMALNDPQPPPEEDMIRFQSDIFAQDVDVVASQRPELLPLDLQAELHLRCDRTSIAYRRWLKERKLSFGVA